MQTVCPFSKESRDFFCSQERAFIAPEKDKLQKTAEYDECAKIALRIFTYTALNYGQRKTLS